MASHTCAITNPLISVMSKLGPTLVVSADCASAAIAPDFAWSFFGAPFSRRCLQSRLSDSEHCLDFDCQSVNPSSCFQRGCGHAEPSTRQTALNRTLQQHPMPPKATPVDAPVRCASAGLGSGRFHSLCKPAPAHGLFRPDSGGAIEWRNRPTRRHRQDRQ
jgi:hypothetical protein